MGMDGWGTQQRSGFLESRQLDGHSASKYVSIIKIIMDNLRVSLITSRAVSSFQTIFIPLSLQSSQKGLTQRGSRRWVLTSNQLVVLAACHNFGSPWVGLDELGALLLQGGLKEEGQDTVMCENYSISGRRKQLDASCELDLPGQANLVFFHVGEASHLLTLDKRSSVAQLNVGEHSWTVADLNLNVSLVLYNPVCAF
jgi:hypothetical protein